MITGLMLNVFSLLMIGYSERLYWTCVVGLLPLRNLFYLIIRKIKRNLQMSPVEQSSALKLYCCRKIMTEQN